MKDQILSFLKQLADKARPIIDKAKPIVDKGLRFGGHRLQVAFTSASGLYWNLSQQNRQRDFVRRLLACCTFHQSYHPIEKALAFFHRYSNDDAVA